MHNKKQNLLLPVIKRRNGNTRRFNKSALAIAQKLIHPNFLAAAPNTANITGTRQIDTIPGTSVWVTKAMAAPERLTNAPIPIIR